MSEAAKELLKLLLQYDLRINRGSPFFKSLFWGPPSLAQTRRHPPDLLRFPYVGVRIDKTRVAVYDVDTCRYI